MYLTVGSRPLRRAREVPTLGVTITILVTGRERSKSSRSNYIYDTRVCTR